MSNQEIFICVKKNCQELERVFYITMDDFYRLNRERKHELVRLQDFKADLARSISPSKINIIKTLREIYYSCKNRLINLLGSHLDGLFESKLGNQCSTIEGVDAIMDNSVDGVLQVKWAVSRITGDIDELFRNIPIIWDEFMSHYNYIYNRCCRALDKFNISDRSVGSTQIKTFVQDMQLQETLGKYMYEEYLTSQQPQYLLASGNVYQQYLTLAYNAESYAKQNQLLLNDLTKNLLMLAKTSKTHKEQCKQIAQNLISKSIILDSSVIGEFKREIMNDDLDEEGYMEIMKLNLPFSFGIPDETPELVASWHFLGKRYVRLQQYKKAHEAFERGYEISLRIEKVGVNTSRIVNASKIGAGPHHYIRPDKFLHRNGKVLLLMQQYKMAKNNFMKAVEARVKRQLNTAAANSKFQLALSHRLLGEYKRAFEINQEIVSSLQGRLRSDTYFELALCSNKLREYVDSNKYLDECYRIRKDLYRESAPQIISITKLRIENSLEQNLFDNSIMFSLKLLETIKQAFGVPTHDQIVAYQIIGLSFACINQGGDAKKYLEKSVFQIVKVYGEKDPRIQNWRKLIQQYYQGRGIEVKDFKKGLLEFTY